MLNYILLFVLMLCVIIWLYRANYKPKIYNEITKKINNKTNNCSKFTDKYFYDVDDITPDLRNIENDRRNILTESYKIQSRSINKTNKSKINTDETLWHDWPEKKLYANNGTWKIFPFYAFGVWVPENCNMCPYTYKFLKSIKGLKLATFSKLSPGMKLTPHRGWGNHSNHVIRCHYGLSVPNGLGCYISVSDTENGKDTKLYHEQFKWLIFDDSKWHYAENKSTHDRIVLIVDIERPAHIKTGTSEVGDSKELLDIVNYFKEKNIKKLDTFEKLP